MDDPASSFLFLFQDQVPLSLTEIVINFLLIFLIVGRTPFSWRQSSRLFRSGGFAFSRLQTRATKTPGGAASFGEPDAVYLGCAVGRDPCLARSRLAANRLLLICFFPCGKIWRRHICSVYCPRSAIAIAFYLIAFLHVVLGELVPKMFAAGKSGNLCIAGGTATLVVCEGIFSGPLGSRSGRLVRGKARASRRRLNTLPCIPKRKFGS